MTKSADKLLCVIYRDYLSRIKLGQSMSDANRFTTDYFETETYSVSKNNDDIIQLKTELRKADLLKVSVSGNANLTPYGIEYMENRFKNGLAEVLDFLSKFLPY